MGTIEVILGSMYAEKSSELIRRVKRYQIAGKKCLVFKHVLDCDRNNTEDILTHSQNTLKAVPVNCVDTIYRNILKQEYDVVAIDEAQFFDEGIVSIAQIISREYDKTIILAGLDMDYNGDPFGYMGDLCCIADDVVKLHAVCMKCGKDAKYSYRKSRDTDIVSIGSKDKYEALCERCYRERIGLNDCLNMDCNNNNNNRINSE